MRVLFAVCFACLLIVLSIVWFMLGMVIEGPLNAQVYFSRQVEQEFNDWSLSLLRRDIRSNSSLSDKKLQEFMRHYGVLSVKPMPVENSVDWLIYARCRKRVHYLCQVGEQGNATWLFRVEKIDGVSCEELLSILVARRNACLKLILFGSCCFMLCLSCFLGPMNKLCVQIRIPRIIYASSLCIMLLVDGVLVLATFISVGISLSELLRVCGG